MFLFNLIKMKLISILFWQQFYYIVRVYIEICCIIANSSISRAGNTPRQWTSWTPWPCPKPPRYCRPPLKLNHYAHDISKARASLPNRSPISFHLLYNPKFIFRKVACSFADDLTYYYIIIWLFLVSCLPEIKRLRCRSCSSWCMSPIHLMDGDVDGLLLLMISCHSLSSGWSERGARGDQSYDADAAAAAALAAGVRTPRNRRNRVKSEWNDGIQVIGTCAVSAHS